MRWSKPRSGMVDGYWQPQELPGLGDEVDEKEAARHPCKPEPRTGSDALLPDGTVVNR